MDFVTNKITAGDYKNSDIILKGIQADEPVLVRKGFLNKKEIPMDKTTIKFLTHSIISDVEHEIVIEWRDGKLSQAIVDHMVYSAVAAKML